MRWVTGTYEASSLAGERAQALIHASLPASPFDFDGAFQQRMDLLRDAGIARELTGKRRNRVFAYDAYLAVLNEGTEAI